ncbi:MAG: T9SS type A sorting domain-containing protein [Sphingobacteriales bacterium]|nr:T9SS type A sorting domain-containing protein [Sphingobacteriales bacterium]
MNIFLRFTITLFTGLFFSINLPAQWIKRDVNYAQHHLYPNVLPYAIHFSGPGNGYIIGNGSILRFDNGKWLPVSTTGEVFGALTAVFTIDPKNTYFAGYWGTLLKYDGNTFKHYHLDSTILLTSIFMTDTAHGWAVGKQGKVFKISGDTAIPYTGTGVADFSRVYFDSPRHGWAIANIGQDFVDTVFAGFVYEYKDDSWQRPVYINDKLNDIAITDSGKVYIAGNKSLYQWNQEANDLEPIPNTQNFPLLKISMANEHFGIAIGAKKYLVLKDGKWQSFKADYTDMTSVFCVDTSTIWSTSTEIFDLSNPPDQSSYEVEKTYNAHCIATFQNNKWKAYPLDYLDTVNIQPLDHFITNITGLGNKHIRINGAALNIPADKDWPDTIPVLDALTEVDHVKIFDKNKAWGNSWFSLSYFHNDSVTGIRPSPDSFVYIDAMNMLDDTSAFLICTPSGAYQNTFIGHMKDRRIVKKYTAPDTRSFISIHFSDRRTGWAVGDSGLIVRYNYDNDSWENVESPSNEALLGVFTIDEDNAWCIGTIRGSLLKWDGKQWSIIPSNTTKLITCLYFTDKDHGWAAGENGIILKYSNGAWSKDTAIGNQHLMTIYMSDKNHGWAGGDYGVIYQYINTDTVESGRVTDTDTFAKISPNPVTSEASVQFNLATKGKVYINFYDQSGHKVATYDLGSLEAGSYTKQLPTANLLKGMYIFHIVSSSGETGRGRFLKL